MIRTALLALIVIGFAGARVKAELDGDGFDAPAVRTVVPPPAVEPELLRKPVLLVVPMDRAPEPLVASVARRLGRAYDVRVRIAPRMRSEDTAWDGERGQLTGNLLLRQMWRRYRAVGHGVAVIGVSDGDVYWTGRPEWKFTFGVVHDSGYGVISTARMDPRNYGEARSAPTVERRLTAMMARYLARLAFDLPPRSPNAQSALRDSIAALDDLDQMTPWVCPARPGDRRPC